MAACRLFRSQGNLPPVLTHRQPWHLVHRAHLHTALRELAISKQGKGKPASLLLSSKVVAVDPEKAEVTLENGDKLSGDVLLGADGVHVRDVDHETKHNDGD